MTANVNYKQRALIVDLDGTLCNNMHRKHLYNAEHKDWKAINEASKFDIPNEWCLEIINLFSMNGYKIIFLTGRADNSKAMTEEWLLRNVGPGVDYELFMRPAKDHRNDDVVKEEIYNFQIAPRYDVLFAIDDRVVVTMMWRRLGVVCLACDDAH